MPFFLFVLGEVADTLTTHAGLLSGARELNPLVANIIQEHGFIGLVLFKTGICLAELVMFILVSPFVTPKTRRNGMLLAAGVAWIPAVTNAIQLIWR